MTLVGVLGAVMDEATDMIATLFRSSVTSQYGTKGTSYWTSCRSRNFGALSNTLFLIFIAEQVPMAVLYLRNGNNWGFTYTMNLSLGMIQTLISAIGIVLTTPAIWVWILRKRQQRRQVSIMSVLMMLSVILFVLMLAIGGIKNYCAFISLWISLVMVVMY